jgi:hypothetical protein
MNAFKTLRRTAGRRATGHRRGAIAQPYRKPVNLVGALSGRAARPIRCAHLYPCPWAKTLLIRSS